MRDILSMEGPGCRAGCAGVTDVACRRARGL